MDLYVNTQSPCESETLGGFGRMEDDRDDIFQGLQADDNICSLYEWTTVLEV
jgi:hypothetical protein